MILLIIAASASFAWSFVHVSQLPNRYPDLFGYKPFNCVMCLSGWTSVLLTLIYAGVIGSLATAVCAPLIFFVAVVAGLYIETVNK